MFHLIITLDYELPPLGRGDVRRLFSDSTLFHGMTNWKPRTGFEEGLLETIHWFESRPEGISALLEQEEGINWE